MRKTNREQQQKSRTRTTILTKILIFLRISYISVKMSLTDDETHCTDFQEVNKNNFKQIKNKAIKVNINKHCTY